jgi:hypothetical protein
VFQAARDALADQDSVVTGVRQRTGTLLAAHALVASFLGAAAVKAKGRHDFGWAALATLVLGLVVSALLVSNWKLRFATDAPLSMPSCTTKQPPRQRRTCSAGWFRRRTAITICVVRLASPCTAPQRSGLVSQWSVSSLLGP